MKGLYFFYGVVSSGKSASMLVRLFQTRGIQDETTMLLKPAVDTRYGTHTSSSRVPGLSAEVDHVVREDENMCDLVENFRDKHGHSRLPTSLFVEEVQFFTPEQIVQLSNLSMKMAVYCYGLRSDYRGHPFPGSAMLMARADMIQEVACACRFCGEHAQYSVCLDASVSDQVSIGGDEKYAPACKACFMLPERRTCDRFR